MFSRYPLIRSFFRCRIQLIKDNFRKSLAKLTFVDALITCLKINDRKAHTFSSGSPFDSIYKFRNKVSPISHLRSVEHDVVTTSLKKANSKLPPRVSYNFGSGNSNERSQKSESISLARNILGSQSAYFADLRLMFKEYSLLPKLKTKELHSCNPLILDDRESPKAYCSEDAFDHQSEVVLPENYEVACSYKAKRPKLGFDNEERRYIIALLKFIAGIELRDQQKICTQRWTQSNKDVFTDFKWSYTFK